MSYHDDMQLRILFLERRNKELEVINADLIKRNKELVSIMDKAYGQVRYTCLHFTNDGDVYPFCMYFERFISNLELCNHISCKDCTNYKCFKEKEND